MNFHQFWSPLEPQNDGFSSGKIRFFTKSRFDEKFDLGMVFFHHFGILFSVFLHIFRDFFGVDFCINFGMDFGSILNFWAPFWEHLGAILAPLA